MKRLYLACVGVVALAGAAAAADLPRSRSPTSKPAIYNPLFTWTGFYLGLNGGGGWGRRTGIRPDRQFGFVGGPHRRHRRLQLADRPSGPRHGRRCRLVRHERNDHTTPARPAAQTSNTWLGTVRGRLGYAFDRFHALCHRRPAVGDIRATTPGFAGAARPISAGPSGPASSSRSPATGPRRPNIFMSTWATSTAGSRAAGHDRQCVVPGPTWCAAASIIGSDHRRGSMEQEPPISRPGVFFCARCFSQRFPGVCAFDLSKMDAGVHGVALASA